MTQAQTAAHTLGETHACGLRESLTVLDAFLDHHRDLIISEDAGLLRIFWMTFIAESTI